MYIVFPKKSNDRKAFRKNKKTRFRKEIIQIKFPRLRTPTWPPWHQNSCELPLMHTSWVFPFWPAPRFCHKFILLKSFPEKAHTSSLELRDSVKSEKNILKCRELSNSGRTYAISLKNTLVNKLTILEIAPHITLTNVQSYHLSR